MINDRKIVETDISGKPIAPSSQLISIVPNSIFSENNPHTQSQTAKQNEIKITFPEHGSIDSKNLELFFKDLITLSHDVRQNFDSLYNLFIDNLICGTAFHFKYTLPDVERAHIFSKVLKIKAEQAHRFVTVIEASEYVSKAHLGFIRKIKIYDGPVVQEHVLMDSKSNAVIFIEEWEEKDNARSDGKFAALNNIIEENGIWYFIGIYLYYDDPLLHEVENRKVMFKRTYENMLEFSKTNDVGRIYEQLQAHVAPSECAMHFNKK